MHRPQGKYTEEDAAALMRELLEAVACAHDMGVMHRDIKVGAVRRLPCRLHGGDGGGGCFVGERRLL